MLTDPVGDAETPAALLDRYEAGLQEHVEAVGDERVAAADGVDEPTVRAVRDGDAGSLDLRAVAAVLAVGAAAGPEETLTAVRDHLLLEMSSAMLTVDRLAAAVAGDLEPREIQGKVEGRLPMTLSEYARIHHAIATTR